MGDDQQAFMVLLAILPVIAWAIHVPSYLTTGTHIQTLLDSKASQITLTAGETYLLTEPLVVHSSVSIQCVGADGNIVSSCIIDGSSKFTWLIFVISLFSFSTNASEMTSHGSMMSFTVQDPPNSTTTPNAKNYTHLSLHGISFVNADFYLGSALFVQVRTFCVKVVNF